MLAVAEAPVAERRELGDARSRAVWRWQLIIALSVLTIVGVTALLTPKTLVDWRFLIGFAIVLSVTLFSLAIRWANVSSKAILGLILVDTIAVFFLSVGSSGLVAFLWVFPVTWIATYYSTATVIGALSLISLMMMAELSFNKFEAGQTSDFIMILIAIGFVAASMRTGSHRNTSIKRLLRAQAQRTERALHRVTEQRERAQLMIDSLDIGVARVASNGSLQLSNKRFRELFSFEATSQMGLARSVEYRTRRGLPTPPAETILMRAARGELLADEVIWLFDLKGKWRALRATTRLMESDGRKDGGLLLIVNEVTENVDPLESHDATMRTISHELRNPLTAVLGHVDLLLERHDLPESARTQAEVIERAGGRMQALIDQALSSPSPESEDGDVEFDLAATTRAAIEAFTPAADGNQIHLQVKFPKPLVITGDAFRIRQVLDNLLSNAIKYSERGGIVTVRGYAESETQVVVEVADTGIGISEEDLPHFFEPDFRAQSARATEIPGTGLGTTISRDIILQAGGTIEVRSKLREGTTVRITLPVEGNRRSS